MKINFLNENKQLKETKAMYEKELETCKIKIDYKGVKIENIENMFCKDIRISVRNNQVILKSTSLELKANEITSVLNKIELVKQDIKAINDTPEWLEWVFETHQD